MAIDQSPLGQHIQELMQEIEDDPEIPENAQIGRMLTIVEILGTDDDNSEFANIRVRANTRPYVALGFLEVAKSLQLKMMGA